MLKSITLTNFKCFKNKTHFPLAQINLLTGVNGHGKSSMLQPLLLLQQSVEMDGYTNKLYLNGTDIELGTLEDVKNSETAVGIHIEIKLNDRCYSLATNDFKLRNGKVIPVNLSDRYLRLVGTEDSMFDPENGYFEELFLHYIAADRMGPQNFYLYTNLHHEHVKVDKQGKYTPFVLLSKQNEKVHSKLCLGQDAQTVLQQTEEWLNEILEGAKVALKEERDTISMSYNTKQTPTRYKPINVGFGYSYILPIIISGLIAKEGEILIVENPEAHLHPAAQSRLTKFLAKVASCGVQVFIETHSEHILNALRVVSVSKDYEIKNTDISVLYFQNNDNQPVMQIPINAKGGIDYWPENFFDQEEQDLSEIFKLTRKK